MNLFWCKANIKRFGLNNLQQDFDIMRIVHTAMDACWYNRCIHRCVNDISHDIKVLMKVIKTETFNVGFTSK